MWKTFFIQCQSILMRHLSSCWIDDKQRKLYIYVPLIFAVRHRAFLRVNLADLSSVSGQ